jgi:hypothetical protein
VVPASEMLRTALPTNDDSRRNAAEAFIEKIYAAPIWRSAGNFPVSHGASIVVGIYLFDLHSDTAGAMCTSTRAWRNRSAAVMRIAKAFEAHRPTMRVLVPLIAFFGETLTAADENRGGKEKINALESGHHSSNTAMLAPDDSSCRRTGLRRARLR